MTNCEIKDLVVALRAARCIGKAESLSLRSRAAETFQEKMTNGGYLLPQEVWDEISAIAAGV
jgi:hypothetical protein